MKKIVLPVVAVAVLAGIVGYASFDGNRTQGFAGLFDLFRADQGGPASKPVDSGPASRPASGPASRPASQPPADCKENNKGSFCGCLNQCDEAQRVSPFSGSITVEGFIKKGNGKQANTFTPGGHPSDCNEGGQSLVYKNGTPYLCTNIQLFKPEGK